MLTMSNGLWVALALLGANTGFSAYLSAASDRLATRWGAFVVCLLFAWASWSVGRVVL